MIVLKFILLFFATNLIHVFLNFTPYEIYLISNLTKLDITICINKSYTK